MAVQPCTDIVKKNVIALHNAGLHMAEAVCSAKAAMMGHFAVPRGVILVSFNRCSYCAVWHMCETEVLNAKLLF